MKDAWSYGLGAIWLAAVVGGMWQMNNYKNVPGEAAQVESDWPEASGIERDEDLPTLLFFAHPHCPCTQASMTELSELAARFPGKVAIVSVFGQPTGDAAKDRSGLAESAAQLPNAKVIFDSKNQEISAFGAKTSGQVLLYSPAGRLLYSGGLTGARGHEGDNGARGAAEMAIAEGKVFEKSMPVFGCSLL